MNVHVYRVLARAAVPVAGAYLWWRGRRDASYRDGWHERLGYLSDTPPAAPIWLHAPSVGEARAVMPLIDAWLSCQTPLWVTTMTPTGRDELLSHYGDRLNVALMPLDTHTAMRRFVDVLKPRAAVFVERDLWPNALMLLAERGVPAALINARISERSAKAYRRLGRLMPQALGTLAAVAAQTDADAKRFQRLGVDAECIAVTGNLKFDRQLSESAIAAGQQLRGKVGFDRPVWVAASVREGEIASVLAAHQQVLVNHPNALLVLVPRHPARFVWPQAGSAAWPETSVSRWSSADAITANTQVVLGDTLGDLVMFLAAGDACFVGGSLVAAGGHNPLEPAALGQPIAMGPEVANVSQIDAWLGEAGGRVRVNDAASLADVIQHWFADPAQRLSLIHI